ncbi:Glyoxalase/fosfomycin resistance/dioxygenase [Klenkia terrae]|uniref:VOC family protein n=1 Tax=Klenkia terrae TaxID=1052259 RepID=UPI001779E675|nr:VOC family protein [Klenkia terrae]SSC25856.1 Glyoxalase/fosfomycin resistance/dioxygenase [Klenkia terrae]
MRPVITLITLGVTDLARARAFYAALGWRESSQSQEEVAFLQGAGTHLGLWSRTELAADSEVADDTGGWGGIPLAHTVGSTAEVDEVLAEAAAAGGTVLRPGTATFWGGYNGVFADPDGHRWEIAHNPAWPLDDAGRSQLPD